MEGERGTVCVTGGAGYVASWLIMRLLQHGYSVRTTIQSDPRYVDHLKILPGASEKLQIFEADLDKPESFEAVINGCTGVFHLAHPMDFEDRVPLDRKIKTSVEAITCILKACLNSKTVQRVVYTSSAAAAAIFNSHGNTSSADAASIFNIHGKDIKEIDENMWTDVEFCRSINAFGMAYAVTKTLTEKAALEFAGKHGLDLVTVLPSMIVGPFLGPNLPVSFSMALALVWGNVEMCKATSKTDLVHIDDVVDAHIFLFECPMAKGRYICSSTDTTIHELARFLSAKYPELQIAKDCLRDVEEEKPMHLSSKKILGLGFKFKYGMEEMYDGAIQRCKEKGFL